MLENMKWYSVMCCIVFAPNITLSIDDKKWIALPHVLQYDFSTLLQTGCMFCNVFLLYRIPSFHLSIRLVLWSNYNVVDPSSVSSYHSHYWVWIPSEGTVYYGSTWLKSIYEINMDSDANGMYKHLQCKWLPAVVRNLCRMWPVRGPVHVR